MSKELEKTYNPSEVEDGIYKKWEDAGCFRPEADPPLVDGSDSVLYSPPYNAPYGSPYEKEGDGVKEKPAYSIIMPPPNATGILHLGHAAMLALEDILIRYHRMKGEKSLWIPGTDHASIATQTKVEKLLKEEGLTRHKLGRGKFLKRIDEYVENSRNTIRSQIRKMGSSCDWSREAFTLDEIRTKAVRAVFKMMYEDGLIYRGERIVNWCPRCHSTLADDEAEYKAQKAKIYTFKYSKDFPFTIATTRPETKLGDTAVAVNPKDERYKEYIGKIFEVDFCGVKLKLKIIADRNVDMDFGTGAVGVTPAHSMVDWQMAEENNLEIIKVIDENGNIKDGFGEFSGKNVEEAREMVLCKLKEGGLMEKEEEMENNLSLCYRCSTPIEPLPSLQWFINVNKKIPKYEKSIKELSLEAVKSGVFGRNKINIVPERFEKSYFHWMGNLRDWCISRQIWYGHQVPVWYRGKKTNGEIYVGIEAPEGEGWVQDEDTLDTWFSSGMWTFTTMANSSEQIKLENGKLVIDSEDFRKYHPTAVLETGYDILFFWVARMIIMTTYAVGDIPFQDVYLHGLIKDEKGRKMSKSLGNTIDPLEMIDKYGTDAVRLSLVIGTTPGNDISLSEEKIAGFRNFTNKLWNMSRYILSKVDEYKIKDVSDIVEGSWTLLPKKGSSADNWILHKAEKVANNITQKIKDYEFSQAGEILRDFTWNDFADWYLEISKFEEGKEEILIFILKNLLKLWHPFMPFVTEKIWEEMENKNMLINEEWPLKGKHSYGYAVDAVNVEDFELIKEIITAIRNARAQYKIKPSSKINAVIYAKGKNLKIIKFDSISIKKLRTGIDELEVKESGEKIKNAIYITLNGIEIYLLIPDFDFSSEIKRLEKEIAEQENRIAVLGKKLANKNFVQRAPQEIVAKEKQKLADWEAGIGKMREQLEHLQP